MQTLFQSINNALTNGYLLVKSDLNVANQKQFVLDACCAHKRFETAVSFNKVNSTEGHGYYNLFSLAIGSKLFFQLHKQLTTLIRNFVGDDRELWFSCWVNYHMPDQVLDWHNHKYCIAHGYVSLDPKNTSTVFEEYAIKNEVGKIYIGPGYRHHKVVVHEPYNTPRITIAFDIVDADIVAEASEKYGFDINLSYIPVK